MSKDEFEPEPSATNAEAQTERPWLIGVRSVVPDAALGAGFARTDAVQVTFQ